MEGKEEANAGFTMKENSYTVAPMTENPTLNPSPNLKIVQFSGNELKKKRGRPRKYAADGPVALSPMPISSSIPLTGLKRSRGRSVDTFINSHKVHHHEGPGVSFKKNLIAGERFSYFVGANFTPHVITVNAGEDVIMKVMTFSQQGSRAICILSATGTISSVTLRQPTSSGGTLTYEGHFEILSLSGSFMPTENGGTKSRSGGLSVSLAGPDGRVMGGGLAGLLVAAGPVQVVVGSFLPGHQQEHYPKKQKIDYMTSVVSTTIHPVYGEEFGGINGATRPVLLPSSFHRNDIPSLNPPEGLANPSTDNNGSTHHDEAEVPSQSDSDDDSY